MKYIDADKLIAEIEKRKKSIDECPFIEAEFGASIKRDVKIKTFDELISLITSLQQEQPEVDLEEEAYMRGFAQGAKEELKDLTPLINRLCEAILFEWNDAADLARKTLTRIKAKEE